MQSRVNLSGNDIDGVIGPITRQATIDHIEGLFASEVPAAPGSGELTETEKSTFEQALAADLARFEIPERIAQDETFAEVEREDNNKLNIVLQFRIPNY